MKTRLRVREVAAAKKISRTRLHHDSEVAYGTIRKIFKNPYTEITVTTLSRLAYAMGAGIHEVIEDVTDEQYETEMESIKARKPQRE